MLSDEVLSGQLQKLFSEASKEPMSDKDYADKFAKIIDDQIKTAKVTVDAGIAVQASGSMGAVAGATTSQGTGTLS